MRDGVSVNWHMGDESHAETAVRGGVTIRPKSIGSFPDLTIWPADMSLSPVIVSAFNGEISEALRKFITDYDDMVDNAEGVNPLVDAGCIDCTSGAVPNDMNTGRCLYHLAKRLLGQPKDRADAA